MFFINPFIFGGGDFESIATVTTGGSTATATLASIPGIYQHLQVRAFLSASNPQQWINMKPNGSNSAISHRLYGNGSSAAAAAYTTTYHSIIGLTGLSYPTVAIVDILDYASTSKTKTVRVFSGYDENGSGSVEMISHLWNSTSAITSLDFVVATGGNIVSGCSFALYGIKAP